MRWILVDLVLALLALGLLAVLLLGLWRRVKALSRSVSAAGAVIATATDALAEAQGAGPLGQAPAGAARRGSAVRSAPAHL